MYSHNTPLFGLRLKIITFIIDAWNKNQSKVFFPKKALTWNTLCTTLNTSSKPRLLPLKKFPEPRAIVWRESASPHRVPCFPWRISTNAPYPFRRVLRMGEKRDAGKLFIARDNKRGGWWPEWS